jgi:hypothetical protein
LKKLFAISLLVLLTYNMVGYYVIFAIRHWQVTQTMSFKIENRQISEAKTFVIKVPLFLPYPTDWEDYEYTTGNFEHQGRYFVKVKQILRQDTLYVHCLEDESQTQLYAELGKHTQSQLADFPSSDQSKTEKISFNNFIKEYLPFSEYYLDFKALLIQRNFYPCATASALIKFSEIPAPPPKAFLS